MRLIGIIGISTVVLYSSRGQSGERSPQMIVREYAFSIALEISEQHQSLLKEKKKIVLAVADNPVRMILENGFLEAFSKKGLLVSTGTDIASPAVVIKIVPLEASLRIRELSGGSLERTFQFSLESRIEDAVGLVLSSASVYHRHSVDTVVSPQRGGAYSFLSAVNETEESWFEKILSPLFLISAAFVMIYLFFHIRS